MGETSKSSTQESPESAEKVKLITEDTADSVPSSLPKLGNMYKQLKNKLSEEKKRESLRNTATFEKEPSSDEEDLPNKDYMSHIEQSEASVGSSSQQKSLFGHFLDPQGNSSQQQYSSQPDQ